MYKGRHAKHSLSRKPGLLLASLLLIVLFTTVGTVAYLVIGTGTITNNFELGTVPNTVVGTADEGMAVQNDGTVDAYVRAAVAVNWMKNEDGQTTVYYEAPKTTDYSLTLNETDWVKGSDGFYYYPTPVEPTGVTADLVTGCVLTGTAPEGYELSVEIMAQTIQADGMDGTTPVVVKTWGAERGSSVTGVSEGVLQVAQ